MADIRKRLLRHIFGAVLEPKKKERRPSRIERSAVESVKRVSSNLTGFLVLCFRLLRKMEAVLRRVPVWCHSCAGRAEASIDPTTNELICRRCQSDCVEESDQNVEEFVGRPGIVANGDEDAIQQVINRVLGMNVPQSRTTTISRDGRPVNIVVRQLGSIRLGELDTVPAAPTDSVHSQQQSAILSLLASLTSTRGGSGRSQARGRWHSLHFDDGAMSDEQANNQWEEFLHYILMNENSHAGAPPASKAALEDLKRVPITADTDVAALGECSITQDPFEVGDVMVPLPCGHSYKQEPIVHWLGMHNTCPVCRVEVTGPAERS